MSTEKPAVLSKTQRLIESIDRLTKAIEARTPPELSITQRDLPPLPRWDPGRPMPKGAAGTKR
jgi:hypothetical protein